MAIAVPVASDDGQLGEVSIFASRHRQHVIIGHEGRIRYVDDFADERLVRLHRRYTAVTRFSAFDHGGVRKCRPFSGSPIVVLYDQWINRAMAVEKTAGTASGVNASG